MFSEDAKRARESMYCPRCLDFTDQVQDPADRRRAIYEECRTSFTLQESNLALMGPLLKLGDRRA